jgi:hypothetical protein
VFPSLYCRRVSLIQDYVCSCSALDSEDLGEMRLRAALMIETLPCFKKVQCLLALPIGAAKIFYYCSVDH